MPFKIQRVPRALQNLLSTSGGETPSELEDRIRGTIDLLQVYGSPQRQVFVNSNAALTEGTSLVVLPGSLNPIILYGVAFTVTQTGTLTALSLSIWLGIPPGGYKVASQEFQQFGATVTGAKALAWYAPYPILLPPRVSVFGTADIIGTDANVSAGITADISELS